MSGSSGVVLPALACRPGTPGDGRSAITPERRGAGTPDFFCHQVSDDDILVSAPITDILMKEAAAKRPVLKGHDTTREPEECRVGGRLGKSIEGEKIMAPEMPPPPKQGRRGQRASSLRLKATAELEESSETDEKVTVPVRPWNTEQGVRVSPKTTAVQRASSLRRKATAELQESSEIDEKVALPVRSWDSEQGIRASSKTGARSGTPGDGRSAMTMERRGAGTPDFFCHQVSDDGILVSAPITDILMKEAAAKRPVLKGHDTTRKPAECRARGRFGKSIEGEKIMAPEMPPPPKQGRRGQRASSLRLKATAELQESSEIDEKVTLPVRQWNTEQGIRVSPKTAVSQRASSLRRKTTTEVQEPFEVDEAIVHARPWNTHEGIQVGPKTATICRASSLRREVAAEFQEGFAGERVIAPMTPRTPRQDGRLCPKSAAIQLASSLGGEAAAELQETFVGEKAMAPVTPPTPRHRGQSGPTTAAAHRASSQRRTMAEERRAAGASSLVAGVSSPTAAGGLPGIFRLEPLKPQVRRTQLIGQDPFSPVLQPTGDHNFDYITPRKERETRFLQ